MTADGQFVFEWVQFNATVDPFTDPSSLRGDQIGELVAPNHRWLFLDDGSLVEDYAYPDDVVAQFLGARPDGPKGHLVLDPAISPRTPGEFYGSWRTLEWF